MKNFLKGLFLGLALCTGLGISSAYATRDNALRQDAKRIYQGLHQEAMEGNGTVCWNTHGYDIKDNDYEYTDEIPAVLNDAPYCVYSNYYNSDNSVGVLSLSGNIFILRNLEDVIVRGDFYGCLLRICGTDDTIRDMVVKNNSRILLLVSDRLKELMKEKDPNWNPEVFKLSEV